MFPATHMAVSRVPGSGGFIASTSETIPRPTSASTSIPAPSAKGGMRMTLPTGTMVTAVYVTSDSKDQVSAFYKGKLGSESFDRSTPRRAPS